tara:strand:+ start:79 stop:840 length:762 start_codon:yes stop_codon:yes gene_type:complete
MFNPATFLRDLKRKIIADKYSRKYENYFVVDGIKFYVPLTIEPNIRYILAKGRSYESDEIRFLKRILEEGVNVVELGGSLGIVSGITRSIIGPLAKHIIVEANPELINICKNNACIHSNTTETEIICKAVSYAPTAKVGFTKGINSHTGRISKLSDEVYYEVEKVELRTLVEKLPGGVPYVLICDIEGAEYDMFKKEHRDTFKNLSFAVIGMRTRIYRSLGLNEEDFFNMLSEKGLKILDRSGDVLLFKGPAK